MKEIPLTRGKVAIVDDDMLDRVSYFKWYLDRRIKKFSTTYYAASTVRMGGSQFKLYMHELICTNVDKPHHIDHKDRDGLNNTKKNLRQSTRGQNQMNSLILRGGSSKFRGVYKKPSGMYVAEICVNGKHIYLGMFFSEARAAEAYNNMAKKHFRKYAKLNIINQEVEKEGQPNQI